jgi:hypothetical protein
MSNTYGWFGKKICKNKWQEDVNGKGDQHKLWDVKIWKKNSATRVSAGSGDCAQGNIFKMMWLIRPQPGREIIYLHVWKTSNFEIWHIMRKLWNKLLSEGRGPRQINVQKDFHIYIRSNSCMMWNPDPWILITIEFFCKFQWKDGT